MRIFLFCLATYSFCLICLHADDVAPKQTSTKSSLNLEVTEYLPGQDPVTFRWPTHVAFGPNNQEIVTDLKNNRLMFRDSSTGLLKPSPIALRGPHSVVYNPKDKLYYANDTDNHRIISFANLSKQTITAQTKQVAGIPLKRPHDTVVDPSTGWIYAINPNSGHVFRFTSIGKDESVIKVPVQGYARALTFANGTLYVIGSAKGRIVEVVDWDTPAFKIYDSFDPTGRSGPAGSWAKTGLVLNDAEFFNGFWYATSYFTKSYAGATDYNKHKFIRFKTFEDFISGKWVDLNYMVPSGMTPYYLTVNRGNLYLAIFNHSQPSIGDSILQFTCSSK